MDARERRKRLYPENRSSSQEESLESLQRMTSTKPRSPRFRFAIFTLILIAILIALAPTIVSMTGLGPRIVASAAKERLDGELKVESISIGWLSSVQAKGVELYDSNGELVASVPEVSLSRGILGLILSGTDLGELTVKKPTLRIALRTDGSNLEDIFRPVMKSARQKSGASTKASPIGLVVNVNNAELEITDTENNKSWQFAPCNLRAKLSKDPKEPMQLKFTGETDRGDFVVEAEAPQSLDNGAQAIHLVCETQGLPLEPFQPLLERAIGRADLRGEVSGKIVAEADLGRSNYLVHAEKFLAKDIRFAATKYLGDDAIEIGEALLDGSAEWKDNVATFHGLSLDSDLAKVDAEGQLALVDIAKLTSLPKTDCQVKGAIDLAKLAKSLPKTLHIREDVEIHDGAIEFEVANLDDNGARRLNFDARTDGLVAFREGEKMEWKQPIEARGALIDGEDGPRIEKLLCQTTGLKVTGDGSAQEGTIQLQGNLNEIAAQVEQFFDLGNAHLSGQAEGIAEWERNKQAGLDAQAQLNLKEFRLELPQMAPWTEQALELQARATGLEYGDQGLGLQGGNLTVASGDDALDVKLQRAVERVSIDTPLPFEFKLAGDLGTWAARIQPFVSLQGMSITGATKVTGELLASMEKMELSRTRIFVANLTADSPKFHARLPKVEITSSAVWDQESKTLTTPDTTILAHPVLTARAVNVTLVAAPNQFRVNGEFATRADLERLFTAIQTPGVAPSGKLIGELETEAHFTQEGGVTKAEVSGQIAKVGYLTARAKGGGNVAQVGKESEWVPLWQEPSFEFGANASYDAARDTLEISSADAVLAGTAVSAQGTVAKLTSQLALEIDGKLDYDLQNLTPKLQSFLGETLLIEGQGSRQFRVQGPLLEGNAKVTSKEETRLVPGDLQGEAGLGWSRIEYLALPMGKGELDAQLKDSVVSIAPMEMPLNDGLIRMSPQLVLRGARPYIQQDKTTLIDHVTITPQMCDTWIKYVAPMLEGATRAEGQFTLDLDGAAIPMDAPKQLDLQGQFVVHKVTVGPGAMAQELIGIAKSVKAMADGKFLEGAVTAPSSQEWLELPQQSIPIDVLDGHVRHENLIMKVKDVTIRTSGSVGIDDQSLDLVAEVPIRDEWLKDEKLRMALKGQTLKIPITGSISKPRIDNGALTQFGQQMALEAGKGVIQNQIGKAMGKGQQALQKKLGLDPNAINEKVDKGAGLFEDEINQGADKIEKGIQKQLGKGLKKLFGE